MSYDIYEVQRDMVMQRKKYQQQVEDTTLCLDARFMAWVALQPETPTTRNAFFLLNTNMLWIEEGDGVFWFAKQPWARSVPKTIENLFKRFVKEQGFLKTQ